MSTTPVRPSDIRLFPRRSLALKGVVLGSQPPEQRKADIALAQRLAHVSPLSEPKLMTVPVRPASKSATSPTRRLPTLSNAHFPGAGGARPRDRLTKTKVNIRTTA
jgi:hypothetical protein